MAKDPSHAVVLVSGGLDSATTLAIARSDGFACSAITFDYGQRHRVELEAARRVANSLSAREHIIMKIDLRAFGGSALTADIAVPKDRIRTEAQAQSYGDSLGCESNIPITYVPARNTIFLSFALALAEVRRAWDIFIGVNAVDYSGYPDCRPQFIGAFEQVANLATRMGVEGSPRNHIRIHAPLIDLTKAEIIKRGVALGVDFGLTSSCYDPAPDGSPCGHCDSCLLRAAGFREAGIADPLLNRT
jgi:7-cyano-7-deazaguanine synthase